MTYQPIMKNGVPLEELLDLYGNKLAFEHAPGQLVIAKCSAKTAIARLVSRYGKNDDAIFEKEDFLTKLAERYESAWFRGIWERQGTKIRIINAEQPLEAVKADIAQLAEEIFPV
jgi:Thymidylate kinase.